MGRRQSLLLTPATFPDEIHAFLGNIQNLTYPRQGWTSDVAIVVCDHGTYVVKRSQGEQFSTWLAREYWVLQVLRDLPLPLPRPCAYLQRCLAGIPESWLIMTCLPGDSLRVVALAEHDQTAKRRVLSAVGQTLARLHRLPIPPQLYAERQEPWLDHMLKQAHYYLQHYEMEGSVQLLKQLEMHRPQLVRPTLIHGDFAVDNVLVADGKVSGIIDWSWGAWGDPRYDLALAIRPKEGLFQTVEDLQSFWDGYGTVALSNKEYDYFVSLYEFF